MADTYWLAFLSNTTSVEDVPENSSSPNKLTCVTSEEFCVDPTWFSQINERNLVFESEGRSNGFEDSSTWVTSNRNRSFAKNNHFGGEPYRIDHETKSTIHSQSNNANDVSLWSVYEDVIYDETDAEFDNIDLLENISITKTIDNSKLSQNNSEIENNNEECLDVSDSINGVNILALGASDKLNCNTRKQCDLNITSNLLSESSEFTTSHRQTVNQMHYFAENAAFSLGTLLREQIVSLVCSTSGVSRYIGAKLSSLKENPWVANVTGCATESILFAAERIRYAAETVSQSIASDDPEVQHLEYIRHGLYGGDWRDVLRLRTPLRSISKANQEMIENVALDSNLNSCLAVIPAGRSDPRTECRYDDLMMLSSIASGDASQLRELGDPSTIDYDEMLDPIEEAGYHLAKMLLPPKFEESNECEECGEEFKFSRYRHHCRNCGKSFCSEHSSYRRKLFHFGFTIPVRVCCRCVNMIDKSERDENLLWKHIRVKDYLSGRLKPYRPPSVDRFIDKISRVTDYSIQAFKKSLLLSYPAMIALETIDILKRYGISGLAGVMLREDFIEAVESLKRISGMDKLYPISLHELTACIYYKLAINRGIRGCMPEEEHFCHQPTRDDYRTAPQSPQEVRDEDLDDVTRLSPLALHAIYAETVVDCQRIGWLQGWELLFADLNSAPEEPAFALFATDVASNVNQAAEFKRRKSNKTNLRHGVGTNGYEKVDCTEGEGNKKRRNQLRERKQAVLVIRGTNSIHDVVTDIRATPVKLPFPLYSDDMFTQLDQMELYPDRKVAKDAWTNQSDFTNYACGGMVRAAFTLIQSVGPSLMDLYKSNCDIYVIGHSLGGGVASLVTYFLHKLIPNIRCIAYGPPCCMSAEISDELRDRVLSVVLHDDVICRITPNSIRMLIKDLVKFRGEVFYNGTVYQHLHSDWNDIIERAGTLWSPRWREVHPRGFGFKTEMVELTDEFVTVSKIKSLSDCDQEQPNLCIQTEEEIDEDAELIDDFVIDLWLPGQIMHIYSHRGQYKAMIVGRSFASLRRIEIQSNIFCDHTCDAISNALQEVIAVRKAVAFPPTYQPFDQSDICNCCHNKFTWHATFRSKPQEYREKHNCKCCGRLVCGPCSTKRHPIAKYGLIYPSRICDSCAYKFEYT